ncbi:MAG TPA: hypothetical protein VMA98_03315 [Candidatus Acidoferrales bacterium]|nr:hypothetical protein [Candidatus Acidoferrales bacterium]
MRRTDFISAVPALALALRAVPGAAAAIADGRPGLWVRYVMGYGVQFQKQAGFGMESTPIATRAFIETQVGLPGGSCNANTARKAYIHGSFGNLLTVYPVIAYVSGSGSLLALDQDSPPPFRMLDSPHLYPTSLQPVSTKSAKVIAPVSPSRFSEESIVAEKHSIDATYGDYPVDGHTLLRFEAWSSPAVPLGFARVRAVLNSMPPFELHLDSYGFGYHPEITDSLDAVRAVN